MNPSEYAKALLRIIRLILSFLLLVCLLLLIGFDLLIELILDNIFFVMLLDVVLVSLSALDLEEIFALRTIEPYLLLFFSCLKTARNIIPIVTIITTGRII